MLSRCLERHPSRVRVPHGEEAGGRTEGTGQPGRQDLCTRHRPGPAAGHALELLACSTGGGALPWACRPEQPAQHGSLPAGPAALMTGLSFLAAPGLLPPGAKQAACLTHPAALAQQLLPCKARGQHPSQSAPAVTGLHPGEAQPGPRGNLAPSSDDTTCQGSRNKQGSSHGLSQRQSRGLTPHERS